MKLLAILVLTTMCATASAQTIKSLGYNTNGQVAYSGTNTLQFTNEVRLNQITFTEGVDSLTISGSQIAWSAGGELIFGESRFAVNNDSVWDWANNDFRLFVPLVFENSGDVAVTRTNLGLGFSALTNISNVTMMRALSGSTNTNHPFSGTVSVVGTNNTNTLTFSNGILQSVQ